MKSNEIQKWIEKGIHHSQVVAYVPSSLARVRRAVEEGVFQDSTIEQLGEESFEIQEFVTLPLIVHPEHLKVALPDIQSETSKALYGQILSDRERVASTIEVSNFTEPKTTAEALSIINAYNRENGYNPILIFDPPESPPNEMLLGALNIIVSRNEAKRRIFLSNSERLEDIGRRAKLQVVGFTGNEPRSNAFEKFYRSIFTSFRKDFAAVIMGFNSKILELKSYRNPSGPLDTVHVRIPKEGLRLEVIEGIEIVK